MSTIYDSKSIPLALLDISRIALGCEAAADINMWLRWLILAPVNVIHEAIELSTKTGASIDRIAFVESQLLQYSARKSAAKKAVKALNEKEN